MPSRPSKPTPARPDGASLPAVVREDRARVRKRQRRREWARALPYLLVAAALHAAGLVWYATLPVDRGLEDVRRALLASFEPEPPPPEPEEPDEAPELEEPESPPLDPLEEVPVLESWTEDVADDRPIGAPDILGLGAAGLGGTGGVRGGLPATEAARGLDLGDSDAGFRDFVEDLRTRGVDVVFVVDATGSMQRILDRARQAVDGLIEQLASIVPNLRIGLVAYRDLDDPWVTRVSGLSRDRYRVQNVLLDLRASGGRRGFSDFEEAVEAGIAAATALAWQPGARRVILLVGDAPDHTQDEEKTLDLVRTFARDKRSTVSTLYVGHAVEGVPSDRRQRAIARFERIADVGGGAAYQLLSDDDDDGAELRARVLDATFGPQWRDDVLALLSRIPDDSRRASVQRHIERGDVDWLVRRLQSPPVYAAVVEGCVDAFSAPIAKACLSLLEDDRADAALRSAAMFVLKRGLPVDLDGVSIDVEAPLGLQEPALAAIRRAVGQLRDAPLPPPVGSLPQAPVRELPLPPDG